MSSSLLRTLLRGTSDTGSALGALSGHTDLIELIWRKIQKRQLTHAVVELRGHRNHVYSLAALADGRVVSGSYDHTLRVWDVTEPSGRCDLTLSGHSDCVYGVAAASRLRTPVAEVGASGGGLFGWLVGWSVGWLSGCLAGGW